MSLHALLQRGIREALAEREGELESYVAERGLDLETAAHLRQALEALPGLLLALDGAIYSPGVPGHARDTFSHVVRYLLLEDDLVPSTDRILVGMLDDAYLLHRAAQELREHVAGVDFRSIDGGVDLLARALPTDVVGLLDDHLAAVVASATES